MLSSSLDKSHGRTCQGQWGIHPLCLTGTLTISPIIFLMPKAASDLMNTPSKVHKLGSEVPNELTHKTKY